MKSHKNTKPAKPSRIGVSKFDYVFALACLVLSTWFLVSRGLIDFTGLALFVFGIGGFLGGFLLFHGAKTIYLKVAKNAELGWLEFVSVIAVALFAVSLFFVFFGFYQEFPAPLPTPKPHAKLPQQLNETLQRIIAADPKDEASCNALGGVWGLCGGLQPSHVCDVRASDAGKVCWSNSDCQAGCFGDVGAPPKKVGDWATGVCAPWLVCNGFGCYTQIEDGRVIQSICVD